MYAYQIRKSLEQCWRYLNMFKKIGSANFIETRQQLTMMVPLDFFRSKPSFRSGWALLDLVLHKNVQRIHHLVSLLWQKFFLVPTYPEHIVMNTYAFGIWYSRCRYLMDLQNDWRPWLGPKWLSLASTCWEMDVWNQTVWHPLLCLWHAHRVPCWP